LAEWQQRLRRFEKSGLTVARFCTRERVSAPTFWYWRRKCARSASAHQAALVLALNRRIHRAYNRVREQNFSLAGLVGFDLHGKTCGIVGTDL
jgi:phosphoglycerate dehydrogenase-like enzyme